MTLFSLKSILQKVPETHLIFKGHQTEDPKMLSYSCFCWAKRVDGYLLIFLCYWCSQC